jgi:DNA-directed RNA polymerase subunit M/transcription elongation factor TFIIS
MDKIGLVKQRACGKCGSPLFHVLSNSDDTVFAIKCTRCGYAITIEAKMVAESKVEEVILDD